MTQGHKVTKSQGHRMHELVPILHQLLRLITICDELSLVAICNQFEMEHTAEIRHTARWG